MHNVSFVLYNSSWRRPETCRNNRRIPSKFDIWHNMWYHISVAFLIDLINRSIWRYYTIFYLNHISEPSEYVEYLHFCNNTSKFSLPENFEMYKALTSISLHGVNEKINFENFKLYNPCFFILIFIKIFTDYIPPSNWIFTSGVNWI